MKSCPESGLAQSLAQSQGSFNASYCHYEDSWRELEIFNLEIEGGTRAAIKSLKKWLVEGELDFI